MKRLLILLFALLIPLAVLAQENPRPTPTPTLRSPGARATFTPAAPMFSVTNTRVFVGSGGEASQPAASFTLSPDCNLPPRLVVGQQGRVAESAFMNDVHQQPGAMGRLLGTIPSGSVFDVLNGPICVGRMVWWYVADTQSDLIGWTPEGAGIIYWLEPLLPAGYVTVTRFGPTPTRTPVGIFEPTRTPPPGSFPTSTRPGVFGPTPTASGLPTLRPNGPRASVTPAAAFGCNGAPPTRLLVGGKGRVTPGLPNNLRQQPGTSSTYLGEIPAGGIFDVLDGPTCASGMWWWQVNYNGVTGWTPEGQGIAYWVEPIY